MNLVCLDGGSFRLLPTLLCTLSPALLFPVVFRLEAARVLGFTGAHSRISRWQPGHDDGHQKEDIF
jgi:hypothetical protein